MRGLSETDASSIHDSQESEMLGTFAGAKRPPSFRLTRKRSRSACASLSVVPTGVVCQRRRPRAADGADGNLAALIEQHQEKLIEDAGTLYRRTTR